MPFLYCLNGRQVINIALRNVVIIGVGVPVQRLFKFEGEIGPVYHRLPQRIRAHSLICFIALILYRIMRMRLKASNREESPTQCH